MRIDVEEIEQEMAGPAGERGQPQSPRTGDAAGRRHERDRRRQPQPDPDAVALGLVMVHAVEQLPREVEIGRQRGPHRNRGAAARRQLVGRRGGDVYGQAGESVRERAGHGGYSVRGKRREETNGTRFDPALLCLAGSNR